MNGGVNCPLVKDIGDCRRVALWTRALYETKDWACALKKRVMDETGANGTAFIHKHISHTNHAHQIIAAFKRLRWAFPDDAIPQGLKKHEPLLTTCHIINICDGRLDTQPTPPHVDKVLNNTHLMMNTHHGWSMETSGVTTSGNMRCALCTQTTPWFSMKNTHCDECEQSGMDENHTNAL